MALCPNSSVIQNAAVLRRRCDGFLGGKKSFPGVVNEGPPKRDRSGCNIRGTVPASSAFSGKITIRYVSANHASKLAVLNVWGCK